MLETVEKTIKLVSGTEVLNVTKNHIFSYVLQKELRIWIRSAGSFSFMLRVFCVMKV